MFSSLSYFPLVCLLYVSNLAPDDFLCRAVAPRLRPLQLLLAACIQSSYCSPTVSASTTPRLCLLRLLLPNCIRFNCCSPVASTSTAAPRLCPLQLLLPDCSTDAPQLHTSACSPSCSGRFQPMAGPNVLEHSSRSSRLSKTKYDLMSHITSLVPPHEYPTSVTHRQIDTHTLES